MNVQTKLQEISQLVGEPLVYETLAKLLQIEKTKCLRKIERLKNELSPYEQRFGMNSLDAWNAYRAGRLGDDMDVMEWMALVENFNAMEEYYQRILASEQYD